MHKRCTEGSFCLRFVLRGSFADCSLIIKVLIPHRQYAYSSYCSLYISYDSDVENLFNSYKLLWWEIICLIFMGIIFDSTVIL